jgi:hypothetical protein
LHRYGSNVEYNVHGNTAVAYKCMKHLNKDEKDTAHLSNTTEDTSLNYYEGVWLTLMK